MPSTLTPAQTRSPIDRINDYLGTEAEWGSLTTDMARYAADVVAEFAALMCFASVGVGPDNTVLFVWRFNAEHLELELFPERRGEWFYLNHDTNAMWEADYQVGAPVDPRVFAFTSNWFGVSTRP